MKESTLGLVLIAISFFLITLGLFRRNSNFVELRKVFIEHMALFKNARYQYFIFYVYPLIMSIGISILYVAEKEMYRDITVAVSIFISMLLAILSIITTKDLSKYEPNQQQRIKEVIKETSNAIVFCTAISIFIICVSLIMTAIDFCKYQYFSRGVAIVIYYLLLVLLLNILLIVKRMGKLLS